MNKLSLVSALLLGVASCAFQPAFAQPIQFQAADGINNTPVSAANPLPTTGGGGGGGTAAPFKPNGNVANLAVTTSSANVALPAGTVDLITNDGASDVSIKLSIGAGTAATTDLILKAGAAMGVDPGTSTFINAIAASGSSHLSIAGGSAGIVSGFGGSQSGGATAALQTTGNSSLGTIASTQGSKAPGTAAANSQLTGCIYTAAGVTLTDGQQAAGQCTPKGQTNVNNAYTYQLESNVSATGNGTTFTNVAGGSYILDIRGTLGGTSVALQVTGADGTLTTLATQTVVGSYGTYPIGANSSVRAVLTGGSPSGVYVSLEGVGSSLVLPNQGATPSSFVAAASTNATNVKAVPASLTHISGFNPTATPTWGTLYDTAGTPTCGTSIKYRIMLPANSTNGSGAVEDFSTPLTFLSGIGFCMSTASDGTGAVAAGAGILNVSAK